LGPWERRGTGRKPKKTLGGHRAGGKEFEKPLRGAWGNQDCLNASQVAVETCGEREEKEKTPILSLQEKLTKKTSTSGKIGRKGGRRYKEPSP